MFSAAVLMHKSLKIWPENYLILKIDILLKKWSFMRQFQLQTPIQEHFSTICVKSVASS